MTNANAINPKPGIQSDGQSKFAKFGGAFVAQGFTMYPVLLLLIIVGAIIAPRFLTAINLINILDQISVLGLTTIGLTFVVLTTLASRRSGSVKTRT